MAPLFFEGLFVCVPDGLCSHIDQSAPARGLTLQRRLRLEHASFVPKGRKAEDGRIDDRFQLTELATTSYPAQRPGKRWHANLDSRMETAARLAAFLDSNGTGGTAKRAQIGPQKCHGPS
ncbi:MAG TPA: putative molybdenum carrier protein [Chthoniobacterales bacterium]